VNFQSARSSTQTTAERMRAHTGPALFSFGFRPFFLFAALWAALAVPLWIASRQFFGGAVLGQDGMTWHIHEMLFGYLAGVMAGFLLTAIPNWTGRLPVTGWPLAGLFGLWCAGRIAMLAAGSLGVWAAVIDAAFLVVFAVVVCREVLAGRNWRNLPVAVMVSLFTAANLAFHFGTLDPGVRDVAVRLALAVGAMLICLIGGRVTPSFTRNWLARQGVDRLPAPVGRFDQATLVLTGISLVAWAAMPDVVWTGAALALAGALNVARLGRWRGLSTGAEPLVWVLHLGYLWTTAGVLLLGLSILEPATVPRAAAIHALTAGGVGVMTLAMMTRASLGHTGQPLTANRATLALYVLANLAALVRVVSAFAPQAYDLLLAIAAGLWLAAFGLFVATYGPLLISPRARAA